MELSEHLTEFTDMNIQVVVMTYESPEIHLAFTRQHNIGYSILSDTDAHYVKAFGILNEAYEPGHRVYGIPHPGIFLVDKQGNVNAKFSEEGYRKRPGMDLLLEAARIMTLNPGGTI